MKAYVCKSMCVRNVLVQGHYRSANTAHRVWPLQETHPSRNAHLCFYLLQWDPCACAYTWQLQVDSTNTLQGCFRVPLSRLLYACIKGASLQHLHSVKRNRLQWCPSHPRWHFTFGFTFDLQHCWLTAVKGSAQQSVLLMSLMTFALALACALNIAAS